MYTTNVSVEGSPTEFAAALATARLVPRIALAPNLALLGVPSRSSKAWSIARCSTASQPYKVSAISVLTFSTAFKHLCPYSGTYRHHAVPMLRERR